MPSKYVPIRINETDDADILGALAGYPDRTARLKQLIREGMKTLGLAVLQPDHQNLPVSPATVRRKAVKEKEGRLPKHGDSARVTPLPELPPPGPSANPFGSKQPSPAEILAERRRQAAERLTKPEPGKDVPNE